MLAEIRRLYEELDKFWKEEICLVAKALKEDCIDTGDFERWNNYHSSLRQTMESWKVCFLPFTMRYGALFFSTDQNTLFRIGYQRVMLKLYAATLRPLLQFVHSSISL